jgi:hypothetical protein
MAREYTDGHFHRQGQLLLFETSGVRQKISVRKTLRDGRARQSAAGKKISVNMSA